MRGHNAGMTIVRNINSTVAVGDDRPAWSHVADAMRRERGRPLSEIETDFGGDTGAIARSLSRIERVRKTARGRAVPF